MAGKEGLLQIRSPYFCVGLVHRDGRVIEATGVIKYMMGWSGRQVADYCRKKGWEWEKVESFPREKLLPQ